MNKQEYIELIAKQLEIEKDNYIREKLYALRRKIKARRKMSEYDVQAEYFLAHTGTDLTITFLKNAKYFPEDKETRDVYICVLSRGNNGYNFKYGQSLKDTKLKKSPTAYDILSCITKYDISSFEDFCADYGYNNDSIKDFKLYEKVKEEGKAICKMFYDCIEELREIQ